MRRKEINIGILIEFVEVGLNSKVATHYESKGYEIPRYWAFGSYRIKHGTKITVKVEDLMSNARAVVEVECDNCRNKKHLAFNNFNRVTSKHNGKYFCHLCSTRLNNIKTEEIERRVELLGEGYRLISAEDYKNQHSPIKIKCNKDHIYTTTIQSVDNGSKCNKCWNERKRLTGELHFNYNPELSEEDRNRERKSEIKVWRNCVFERDCSICQCCGQVGGKLNAHHMDSYDWCKEKRYDVDNGIALCFKCHIEFHDLFGYGKNTKKQTEEFILTYGTLTDEMKERIKREQRSKGSRRIKLTTEEIYKVKWLISNTDLYNKDIGNLVNNISRTTVDKIKNNDRYEYITLPENYKPDEFLLENLEKMKSTNKSKLSKNSKVNYDQVKEIKTLLLNKNSYDYISNKLKVKKNVISEINHGKTFKNVDIDGNIEINYPIYNLNNKKKKDLVSTI